MRSSAQVCERGEEELFVSQYRLSVRFLRVRTRTEYNSSRCCRSSKINDVGGSLVRTQYANLGTNNGGTYYLPRYLRVISANWQGERVALVTGLPTFAVCNGNGSLLCTYRYPPAYGA